MADSATPGNAGSNTRRLVLAGAGLVGASTAATSAVSLYSLAVLCGIPAPLAAALPIALDAGAGVAALVWITERGELRTWGRGVAVTALVATLAGNGVQHAITSGLLAVTLPLVLLVGACIPAMLWAVVHLAALMARTPSDVSTVAARQAMGRLYEQLGTTTIPRRPTVKPRPERTRPAEEPVKSKLSPQEWARQNWPVNGGEIRLATGCSKGYAYKVAAEVKAEQEAAS